MKTEFLQKTKRTRKFIQFNELMNERWILSTYKPKAIVNFEVSHNLLNVKNIYQHFGERSLPFEKKKLIHTITWRWTKTTYQSETCEIFNNWPITKKNSCKIQISTGIGINILLLFFLFYGFCVESIHCNENPWYNQFKIIHIAGKLFTLSK